jgi:hypothetical protein
MKTPRHALPTTCEQFYLRSEMVAALATIGLGSLGAVVPAYANPPAPTPRVVAVKSGMPGVAISNEGAGAGAIVDGNQVSARTWAGTAKIGANPVLFDFNARVGPVMVGSTYVYGGAITVFNTNASGGTETINAISTSGDFGYTSATCFPTAVLAPYGGCVIDLSFSPLVAGVRTGQLTLNASGATPTTFTVSLSGVGVDPPARQVPMVQTFPDRVVFGSQKVGTTSGSQFVEITNVGDNYMWFDNFATIGDFAFIPANYYGYAAAPVDETKITSTQIGKCAYSLNVGSTCVAEVNFTPTGTGVRNGSLYIKSYVYDSNLGTYNYKTTRVGLVGTGEDVPVRPLSAPGTISFPEQLFGTQSEPIDFTLTNFGSDPLEILPIEPTGDFSATSDCGVLATGESCTVSAVFSPAELGLRSGQAVIQTLPDTGDYLVNLFGTGLVNPNPVLLLSKAAIGYGNSLIGTANSVPVTLTSAGQVPVSIGKIYSLGDFFQTNDCPAILNPGLKCIVKIGFLPSVLGLRRGELAVESNAFGSPAIVKLSGTACKFFSIAGQRTRYLQCLPGGF